MQQINANVNKTTQINISSLMPSLPMPRLSDTLIDAAATVAEVYSLFSGQVNIITIPVAEGQVVRDNVSNTDNTLIVTSNIFDPRNPTLIINSNDNLGGKVNSVTISNADGDITIMLDTTDLLTLDLRLTAQLRLMILCWLEIKCLPI
jgi:hypothetical protein